ncbi:MAG TPA: hypothetical protein VKX17_25360 [Planctomycetota bacterium]|nr:hypothetical protein [Planctomycetota bacterium]
MCNKFTSRMAWAGVALSLMLGTVAFSTRAAQGSDAPAAKAAEGTIDIVIKGQVYKGEIVLPCTETEFKFKIAGLEPVAFRWADMDEYETKRVQKLYGMEVKDDRLVFGEKAEGVRWKLKSDKFIEGLRIPDRDRLGMKALRTASMPLLLIPESEIVSEDTIECYESDFYSPMEVYQRKMLEQPPGSDDAAANLAMAKWCANIGLYAVAIDHLEKAKIIDPRTEERNSDFRSELVKLAANKGGSDLYQMMVREVNGQDFLSAYDSLQKFDRQFTNTDIKSRVDNLRATIMDGFQKGVNKQIVTMSYRVAMDLVQTKLLTKLRIDEKGNIVPSIPGKQVTTKQGHYFRGILVSEGGVAVAQTDDPYEKADPSAKAPGTSTPAATAKAPGSTQGDVSLKSGDTTINIPGKDILSIVDCDLSESKGTAEASFDELKAYVTEADGLKKEMIQKISKLVKMSAADVQKIFDGRLAKTIDYNGGDARINNNYANFHDADYGIGSWLRPGAPKPMKYIKKEKNQPSAQRYGGGQFGNQRNQQQQQQQQQEEETAESTDDPAIWWKFQTTATKLKVLQAWAAEKVFKTTYVSTVGCQTCGNKGMLGINQPGGNDMMQRCPTCRGSGLLYKIQYH